MKINLGCGYKKLGDCVNVDIDERMHPDVIADFNKPLPFESNSCDLVICEQVLEHLVNYKNLIREVHRILKAGCLAIFTVPKFPCIAAIADPDHVSYFVDESFMHFGNPLWFMPSNFSDKGLFDFSETVSIHWKNKNEPNGQAGRYFTELRVEMKKVFPEYWEGRGNTPVKNISIIKDRDENSLSR